MRDCWRFQFGLVMSRCANGRHAQRWARWKAAFAQGCNVFFSSICFSCLLFFLLILACFSFLVILACFSSICYSWLRGSERATETRRWRRPQKSDSSPEAVGRSFCEEEWRCVHRSSVAENCDDHSADAIATAVRTGEAEGWFGSIGEVAVPPTPTPPPTHPPTPTTTTHPHNFAPHQRTPTLLPFPLSSHPPPSPFAVLT